jgi:hypothetical protein
VSPNNCTFDAGDPQPNRTEICKYEIDWEPAGPFPVAQVKFYSRACTSASAKHSNPWASSFPFADVKLYELVYVQACAFMPCAALTCTQHNMLVMCQ